MNRLLNDVQTKYKTSSIIITDDLTCAQQTCSRVAILNGGKITAEGSFEKVFHKDDELAKSFYEYNFID